ncbi:MAG TPA: hydroxymethylglutaryl-CoA reductase [Thermoanaerobaculia bacterium]|nr:hydroxymethylglutaryl-CoA reductase [Thermoanaerobaculia bacterium]
MTVTERRDVALVPRGKGQGYTDEDLELRRAWVEERTGCRLEHAAASTIPAADLRGNVENAVGSVQVPLGVAGPLRILGEHACGEFYVPLATTEGAVVRSYERGMVAVTRAGGVTARVWIDENRISPIFTFSDVARAREFARRLPELTEGARAAAEATTRHGRLLRLDPHPVGRRVIVDLCFSTGDAHGMNMVSRAADAACRWLIRALRAESGSSGDAGVEGFRLFSGREGEKRMAGSLLAGGKGKTVTAGVRLPRRIVRAVLGATPEALAGLFHDTVLGHLQAGALGHNAHAANGLAALFIACGQDVANVANSALALTEMELTPEGDLHATVTLPSLVVATVGGGTALPTARECLEMLGCFGSGGAPKLAEIAAATVLAGELSFSAAIAAGETVTAHETFGRNRPEEESIDG